MKRSSIIFILLILIHHNLPAGISDVVDLDLVSAVKLGIRNNYDLKYNRIEQLLSKRIVTENWRRFLPALSIDYGNSFNVTPYEQDSRMHTLTFKVTQPVYQGGRYFAAYRIARLNEKMKRMTYHILLNSLKAAIQKQYFTVLIQKEIIQIQNKMEEQALMQVKFAQAENNLGMLTTIDLAEIEAYAKNAQLDHVRAKNALSEEYNNLKRVLYLDWQHKVNISEDITKTFQYKELRKGIKELVSLAYIKRKDLINMCSEVMQRHYDYKSNKYYYLPAVSLNFDYSLTGEKFFPFKRSWNIGVQLDFMFKGTTVSQKGNYGESINDESKNISSSHSVSPFDDIGYVSRYIQSEANFKTSRVKLEQLKQDIAIEIENKYYLVKEKWDLLEILKEREEVLKKRFDVFDIKLKLGEAKRVDVVEAETEYYMARTETMKGILDYISAVVDLELALGTDIGYLNIINKR
ncbi:MAG: TolC family protein [Spirochaetes bacterium]|nr:TolC family protein [Spirochaetota bacterium]